MADEDYLKAQENIRANLTGVSGALENVKRSLIMTERTFLKRTYAIVSLALESYFLISGGVKTLKRVGEVCEYG